MGALWKATRPLHTVSVICRHHHCFFMVLLRLFLIFHIGGSSSSSFAMYIYICFMMSHFLSLIACPRYLLFSHDRWVEGITLWLVISRNLLLFVTEQVKLLCLQIHIARLFTIWDIKYLCFSRNSGVVQRRSCQRSHVAQSPWQPAGLDVQPHTVDERHCLSGLLSIPPPLRVTLPMEGSLPRSQSYHISGKIYILFFLSPILWAFYWILVVLLSVIYLSLLQPSQKLLKLKTKTLGCIIHGHLWPTEASMMTC